MESEGVLLPRIHEHVMVPWNHYGKGDCCGRIEAITDGYLCEKCGFFVHKKCWEASEYIQHPSHPGHTLQLQNDGRRRRCNLCGGQIGGSLVYHCETCNFYMDLYCTKYPPPDVLDISDTHHHKLTLVKRDNNYFNCYAKCGNHKHSFPYKCDECDIAFHVNCVWHALEVKHPIEYTTLDAGERVSLPWIHYHFMMPWNDLRKGDCCGRSDSIGDGYYCKTKTCDFFVHKKCGDKIPEFIQHPSHSLHTLWLQITSDIYCNLCGKDIVDLSYSCKICFFDIDVYCLKYPPPKVIENSETDHHKLTLNDNIIEDFDCGAKCGKTHYGFHYASHDLAFHVDCIWHPTEVEHPLEVNNFYHSSHPLKLFMGQLPNYSDGKCRLCGHKIDDRLFYHCSSCNFTLDLRCVLHPPPRSLLDLKAHDHQLTLLSRLNSFTCNVCGLKGDRSPYICVLCDFMIHQDCLCLPLVININRHEHRISRVSVLGVMNSVCGVCRKKVDWTFGGYSCEKCLHYVVHSKCATRGDVWNGKELEGVTEEIEDIEPYVVIDENTIQHFSHTEHYLLFHVNGVMYVDSKRCSACIHPIGHQSFYGCTVCDFVLHQNCAKCPKKIRHVLHNEQLTLATREGDRFRCDGCHRMSSGFVYEHGKMELDVWCSSISEPFVHPSHPHPLYFFPRTKTEMCRGCNEEETLVLVCIEDGCDFYLCFECATLPQVVKHRVEDHPLLLCYGDEKVTGKYWFDICEKETSPNRWFYTCRDHRASLHIYCVFGDFAWLMPRRTIKFWRGVYEVVLNNSASRPFCKGCQFRCLYPMILKKVSTSDTYCRYYCI